MEKYTFTEIFSNQLPRTDGEVRVYKLSDEIISKYSKNQKRPVFNQENVEVGVAKIDIKAKTATVIFNDYYKKQASKSQSKKGTKK